ncbi:hypothetical protein LPJ64_000517 [Coemansia asiatica]|uniref:SH3 domain-containing protein n=1 Tax=Coemansia asiatica TaxID=1052880 RepID=A0A9W7XMW1_9FUNG|nr:hypothetical protein LPJ64_000517 [Coemansia asiatica]
MAEKFLAKAHHAYSKAKADELDLSPGDIIRVTNDEHESWWVGHNQMTNEQGWFPSNFVDKIKSKPESKPRLKSKRYVRVIKPYEATDEDDLSLQVGDKVEVQKEVDGWFLGSLNGNVGMFPVSHAEEVGPEEGAARRPLPPPPVSAARRGTFSSGNPPGAALPPAPQQQQQQVPPMLPSRNPPLPPRASTDVSRPVGEDAAEETKRDKKSGHRISRLFGTKKGKSKEKDAAEPASEQREQPARSATGDSEEPRLSVADKAAFEEESDGEMVSPALPSRPLPQPNVGGAAALTSPQPPSARALPPIPAPALAKPPPLPAAAMPSAPDRRPSNASQHSQSPGPNAQSLSAAAPVAEDAKSEAEAEAESKDSAEAANNNEHTADSSASAAVTDDNQQPEAPESATKAKGSAKLAKIIEDYEAQSSEELNLMSGDVVTIIARGSEEEPRWKGEYHGKKGYFPAHVVEPIEESADLDEEDGDGSNKPRGFKLAAYGVQQGGLGSIFAGAGVPALRKSATRKVDSEDGADSQAQAASVAAAPAMAPMIPKLRSVQRPALKEEQPKEAQQPNFLAHLNRVPRKSVASDESPSPASLAAAPILPISRKSTAASGSLGDAESENKKKADEEAARPESFENAESIKEVKHEPDVDDPLNAAVADNSDALSSYEKPEERSRGVSRASAEIESAASASGADAVGSTAAAQQNQQDQEKEEEQEEEKEEEDDDDDEQEKAIREDFNEPETEPLAQQPAAESIKRTEEAIEEDSESGKSETAGSSKSSLDPVKSPALPQVKRLVRRGPRQKPTAEGIKKSSEDSQSQQLKNALQKDTDAEPEPEVEAEQPKAARPPPPEKPKGLARHGPFSGPQLPTGGFKASGRIGSAMASRLAALQARASGNNADDDDDSSRNNTPAASATPAAVPVAAVPSATTDSSSFNPPPVGKKPSFTPRTVASKPIESVASPVSSEWQKQVEDEQSQLRSELDKIKRSNDQQTNQLSSKLAASERENQAHRQTISALEHQVEALSEQLSALKSGVSDVQQSVSSLGSKKSLTADNVSLIVRDELRSALEPIRKQNQDLVAENKVLHKMIMDLRTYVDELVVEEGE